MVEIATEEKQRLEDKQRAREQSYESSHKTHKPVWFTHSIVQGEEMYLSNNRYWDEKIKGRWLHCM